MIGETGIEPDRHGFLRVVENRRPIFTGVPFTKALNCSSGTSGRSGISSGLFAGASTADR
jgi:hypothetical protein